MATIEQNVAAIRQAVYGRDVREAIAEGIEKCYTDVLQAKTIADTVLENATEAIRNANTAATNAQTQANNAASALNDLNSLINPASVSDTKEYLGIATEEASE